MSFSQSSADEQSQRWHCALSHWSLWEMFCQGPSQMLQRAPLQPTLDVQKV